MGVHTAARSTVLGGTSVRSCAVGTASVRSAIGKRGGAVTTHSWRLRHRFRTASSRSTDQATARFTVTLDFPTPPLPKAMGRYQPLACCEQDTLGRKLIQNVAGVGCYRGNQGGHVVEEAGDGFVGVAPWCGRTGRPITKLVPQSTGGALPIDGAGRDRAELNNHSRRPDVRRRCPSAASEFDARAG